MQVHESMTERVIAIEANSTLRQAAKRMIRYGVGSIIAVRNGKPSGIVTHTDVVEAGAATDEPFSHLPLEKVMTHPVVTVRPTATVRNAIEVMEENEIKHLPVTADGNLHGIITSSDIVSCHDELRSEVEALRETPPATATEQESADDAQP